MTIKFSLKSVDLRAVSIVSVCILLLSAFRVLRAVMLPEWQNFSPVAAVALCGGLLLPGALAWTLPLLALFVSDLLLSFFLNYPAFGAGQFAAWGSIILTIGIGRLMASRGSFSLMGFFGAVFAGGVVFYLLTNAVCWVTMPAYPRGLDGLWMSLTTGLAGYPASWLFFRNSFISDVLFASVLLALWAFAKSRDAKGCVTAEKA
jgi:hypothetical protein